MCNKFHFFRKRTPRVRRSLCQFLYLAALNIFLYGTICHLVPVLICFVCECVLVFVCFCVCEVTN